MILGKLLRPCSTRSQKQTTLGTPLTQHPALILMFQEDHNHVHRQKREIFDVSCVREWEIVYSTKRCVLLRFRICTGRLPLRNNDNSGILGSSASLRLSAFQLKASPYCSTKPRIFWDFEGFVPDVLRSTKPSKPRGFRGLLVYETPKSRGKYGFVPPNSREVQCFVPRAVRSTLLCTLALDIGYHRRSIPK